MNNLECKRCGLLKTTIEATGKLCVGVSVNLPHHDFVQYCSNPDCDGDYEIIPNGHLHREDSNGHLKSVVSSVSIFIDPLDQILMDFYLACWTANEEGKTEIINYSQWSAKIRKLMEYEKHRDEKFESFIGGTYPPTKKGHSIDVDGNCNQGCC